MTHSPTNNKILFILIKKKKNCQQQTEEIASEIIAAYEVDVAGQETQEYHFTEPFYKW